MTIPKRTVPVIIDNDGTLFTKVWYAFLNTLGGAGSVTNAILANMAQSTIKGRAAAAGTGTPQDLTPTQVVTILNAAAQMTLLPGGLIKRVIEDGVTVTIPTGYQAVVVTDFQIQGTGNLIIEGTSDFAIL